MREEELKKYFNEFASVVYLEESQDKGLLEAFQIIENIFQPHISYSIWHSN